jgi:hypothetical protein
LLETGKLSLKPQLIRPVSRVIVLEVVFLVMFLLETAKTFTETKAKTEFFLVMHVPG